MIRFNKPTIGKRDLESVLYCMIGDDLTPGNYLREFTKMLSDHFSTRNIAVFNSYFFCYEVAFQFLELSKGDEVIIPSYARYGILHSIMKSGLKPIVVDVDIETLMPERSQVRAKVGKNTGCMIIPQMFGIPNEFDDYREFGIPIIEDLDGCMWAKVNGKLAGSFGDYAVVGFNDYSQITTGGGGGLISRSNKLSPWLKQFMSYNHGLDYLMSDFNASLGVSQMKNLPKNIEARIRIGRYYDDAVYNSGCGFVGRRDNREISYPCYVVSTETPFPEIEKFFKKEGIPVKRAIEKPLHQFLGMDDTEFPATMELYRKTIALPIYPMLDRRSVESIAKGIRAIL